MHIKLVFFNLILIAFQPAVRVSRARLVYAYDVRGAVLFRVRALPDCWAELGEITPAIAPY